MTDRELWEEGWLDEAPRTGDLAPRVEEYLNTRARACGKPPDFWVEMVAQWFEEERQRLAGQRLEAELWRARAELRKMRAEWFDRKRGRSG